MNVANFWLPRLSCSCRSKALLKIERAEASHHLVEAEGPRHRGLGACKAAGTLAEPAGRTDRRRGELAGLAGRPCKALRTPMTFREYVAKPTQSAREAQRQFSSIEPTQSQAVRPLQQACRQSGPRRQQQQQYQHLVRSLNNAYLPQ